MFQKPIQFNQAQSYAVWKKGNFTSAFILTI